VPRTGRGRPIKGNGTFRRKSSCKGSCSGDPRASGRLERHAMHGWRTGRTDPVRLDPRRWAGPILRGMGSKDDRLCG